MVNTSDAIVRSYIPKENRGTALKVIYNTRWYTILLRVPYAYKEKIETCLKKIGAISTDYCKKPLRATFSLRPDMCMEHTFRILSTDEIITLSSYDLLMNDPQFTSASYRTGSMDIYYINGPYIPLEPPVTCKGMRDIEDLKRGITPEDRLAIKQWKKEFKAKLEPANREHPQGSMQLDPMNKFYKAFYERRNLT